MPTPVPCLPLPLGLEYPRLGWGVKRWEFDARATVMSNLKLHEAFLDPISHVVNFFIATSPKPFAQEGSYRLSL